MPIIAPISVNSLVPNPRVVPAGDPTRMPDVIVGFCGSNGHAVFIDGDMSGAKGCLRGFSGQRLRAKIDKEKMRVSPARHQLQAACLQALSQGLRIVHDGAGIGFELRPQRLAEGDSLGGDDVHQRSALQARKDRGVDLLGEVRVVCKDDRAARAAQCLMGGGRCNMGMREGARMRAARDEPGEVGHVNQEKRADLVRDLPEPLEIDDARIGRTARDDQARLVFAGQASRPGRSR